MQRTIGMIFQPHHSAGRRSRGASNPVGRGSSRAKAPPERPSTVLAALLLLALCFTARAQIKTGSDGSDLALNPTSDTVIDMHDHPNGIYQYTSVNIPANVTVTFIPNANNTPVTWLVQGNVTINGAITLTGQTSSGTSPTGGIGGPGGGSGGNGGSTPVSGQGYGGGSANLGKDGANASYATLGAINNNQIPPGLTYGNAFLLPLIGGSGGGGSSSGGGGGGGGAILIAASGAISLSGQVWSTGGNKSGGSWFWSRKRRGSQIRCRANFWKRIRRRLRRSLR